MKKAPLYHARKLRKLSQEQVGTLLGGIDKSSVSRYENYKSRPEEPILDKIADFVGRPKDELADDYERNVPAPAEQRRAS